MVKQLKFKAIRHVENYYVAQTPAGKVIIYPFDSYTVAEIKGSIYVLAYGLRSYKLFNEHREKAVELLPNGFKKVISYVKVHYPSSIIKDSTKYINSKKENVNLIGLDTILSGFFQELSPETTYTDKEFKDLIESALDIMEASNVTDKQKKDLFELGTNHVEDDVKVLSETMLQLISEMVRSGVLQSLTDIHKMMKESL